jgi:hypothetical protein
MLLIDHGETLSLFTISAMTSMALRVVEFSRQGYKIGKGFAQKSTVVK